MAAETLEERMRYAQRFPVDSPERAEVFGRIVEEYTPQLSGFLAKRLHNREDVEDLVQDTYARVWRAFDRYNADQKFSSWIYTIANNLLKNKYRNNSRKKETSIEELEPSVRVALRTNTASPLDATYNGELRERIDYALRRMDRHHRVPFVMREVEDHTYEEISDALGVPVGTVKSRLFRARTAFHDLFAEYSRHMAEEFRPDGGSDRLRYTRRAA